MNQKHLLRRYAIELIITLAIYTAIIQFCVYLLTNVIRTEEMQALVIWVLMFAPSLPVAFILFTMFRLLQNSDELQQRIQLFAISFAAGLTGLLTFTYSYLQQLGAPKLDFICVLPIMLILWGIGVVYFARKYR